jgi:alanyl-tRNA synthetase
MGYSRTKEGRYVPLKQKNVDTGMGLERVLQVLNGLPSVYETDVLQPITDKLRVLGRVRSPSPEQVRAMRVIADHVRAAAMALADDRGLVPSNVEQGYVIRRLLRVAIRRGLQLGIDQDFLADLIPPVIETLGDEYPELRRNETHVVTEIGKEEKRFRSTVRRGLRICEKIMTEKGALTGRDAFMLFSTYGFPLEMTVQIAQEQGQKVDLEEFRDEFEHHRELSRDATQQRFTSGLADHSDAVVQLHTATHLLHAGLRRFVDSSIRQKGSNITNERLRLDVHLSRKLTPAELRHVEDWVNDIIRRDLPVTCEVMSPKEAIARGALGFFGEKYGERVSVYTVGDTSKEICAGPHVEHTGVLGKFRLQKQERIGADTLRLRAVLEHS